jgi:uncharacterized membrane protein YqiK
MALSTLLPRNDDENAGTVAVVIFIAGAVILVLAIILILLFFKKRRSGKAKTFIPRLERQRGGKYGKLDEDEEQAWSAEVGDGGHDQKGSYAPVRMGEK